MQINKRFFGLLVGSVLLLALLAACGSETSGTGAATQPTSHSGMDMGTSEATATTTSDPMTDSLKPLQGKEFEIKFMQDMIVHHQSAIAMAQLVPDHTKRPELLTLSKNITTAQTKEITEMTNWLSEWYQEKPVSDSMSVPGMMDMMGDMEKLKNAKDAEFDKLFIDMMIKHHQQAVSMAQLIPDKTQRPELVQLGKNIVQTQSAEIKEMQGWQKEWFKS
ncbi:hypothetical protein KSF_111850 [Reticulibacter mediterranei]|uniref:DUF305 domain-containing protein n=1 Tax=Reticulibacter mediterranei TaxID=2778369 RepID=A0A8J3N769_9CHLR|nr:DUF305 domain-containing protein [Reticulibacter mediterranei]GHP01138.1 hypothetical protein KSF_111850 [Reticulibacter mediterranei]